MQSFIDTVMNPTLLATMAVAVAVFATVITLTMPLLQRDRLNQRISCAPYGFRIWPQKIA